MTPPDKPQRWTTVGWWSIWATTFLFSLLPPAVYHWRKIAEIIEPYRWGPGLLQGHLLILRHLGRLSHWIPVALIAFLILAVRRRSARNAAIAAGAFLTAIFSSFYAACILIVLSMYLVD